MTHLSPMYPWLAPARAALNQAIESNQLGHAPMLLGPPGVGKRALARWLVARLLCRDVIDGEPCGQCHSCQLLASGSHPDFFDLGVLEDKTEIVVDQVRAFISSLGLTASIGSRRTGLIEPADRLNLNAANALLKTLEEPSSEVWLILVTDHEDRLPATVRSRCQRRYVGLPDPDAAIGWLSERNAGRDPEDCLMALELADGAPLLADRWLAEGLAQGKEMRDALQALLRGEPEPPDLVEKWQQAPEQTWNWLARLSQAWLRQWISGLPSKPAIEFMPTGNGDIEAVLVECWNIALEGRRLSARPVRHDWLIRRWLIEWRALGGSPGG